MAPRGFSWPVCRTCSGKLQYMASLPLSKDLEVVNRAVSALLLFQCQHNPGLCDEWEPESGGNAALVVQTTDAVEIVPPKDSVPLKSGSGVGLRLFQEPIDPDESEALYNDAFNMNGSKVIGKAGGLPFWVQTDATPTCSCGTKMKFIAQLEERAARGLNFGGGGTVYSFVCPACRVSAKQLFQRS
jgi:hypothetical protein